MSGPSSEVPGDSQPPFSSTPSSLREKFAVETREALRDADPRLLMFSVVNAALPEFTYGRVRTTLFKLAGAALQRGTVILGKLAVVGPRGCISRLKAGEGCTIGPDVTLGLDAAITLGRGVSIGPGSTLYTGTHELGPGSQRMSPTVAPRPIVVEDGVWIGMRALILPGVRIGRGAVVAAGSVVHEDVAPSTLVQGNPAKPVRVLPLANR